MNDTDELPPRTGPLEKAMQVWVRVDRPRKHFEHRYKGPFDVISQQQQTIKIKKIDGTTDTVSKRRCKPVHFPSTAMFDKPVTETNSTNDTEVNASNTPNQADRNKTIAQTRETKVGRSGDKSKNDALAPNQGATKPDKDSTKNPDKDSRKKPDYDSTKHTTVTTRYGRVVKPILKTTETNPTTERSGRKIHFIKSPHFHYI